MKDSVNVSWIKNMAFEAEIGGHKITIDADVGVGGDNLGPKPKPLMLVALAGCTGMDVVFLMRKMRVNFDKFNIRVDADLTEEHPKQYIRMHIIYEVFGKDLPYDKIQRAVELSQDKYCGVSATYRDVLELTYKIELYEV